jgi:hypothetical protein
VRLDPSAREEIMATSDLSARSRCRQAPPDPRLDDGVGAAPLAAHGVDPETGPGLVELVALDGTPCSARDEVLDRLGEPGGDTP